MWTDVHMQWVDGMEPITCEQSIDMNQIWISGQRVHSSGKIPNSGIFQLAVGCNGKFPKFGEIGYFTGISGENVIFGKKKSFLIINFYKLKKSRYGHRWIVNWMYIDSLIFVSIFDHRTIMFSMCYPVWKVTV